MINRVDRVVEYNVKDYGAVGNGVINDTAAIQRAVDAAYAANGGTVRLPPGLYNVTTITMKPKVSWAGDGSQTSALNGIGAGPVMTSAALIRNVTYRDFIILNSNNTNPNVDLMDWKYGFSGVVMTNVFLYGKGSNTRHGIRIRGKNPDTSAINSTYYNTFINIFLEGETAITGNGLWLDGDGFGVNANVFINFNCAAFSAPVVCEGTGNSWLGGQLINAVTHGFYFYGESENNVVSGMFFDGDWTGVNKVELNNSDSGEKRMVSLIACENLSYPTYTKNVVCSGTNAANIRYTILGETQYTTGAAGYATGTVQKLWAGEASLKVHTGNYFFVDLDLYDDAGTVTVDDYSSGDFPPPAGMSREIVIVFKQAAAGSLTVTPGNLMKFAGGSFPMTATANAICVVKMVWSPQDSCWHEVSRALDVK